MTSDFVTGTCGGCGDEITFRKGDEKVAECAECYFDRTLDDDYYEGAEAA